MGIDILRYIVCNYGTLFRIKDHNSYLVINLIKGFSLPFVRDIFFIKQRHTHTTELIHLRALVFSRCKKFQSTIAQLKLKEIMKPKTTITNIQTRKTKKIKIN